MGSPAAGPEVVRSIQRLAELADPWERLARCEPTPFGSHAWFSAWWRAFGAAHELHVLALWDAAELAALYPLAVERAPRGVLHTALANVHSPLFRPLARDPAALREISAAALRLAPPRLLVEPLPAEDSALGELERAAAAAGAHTLRSPRHVSPIVDTSGDFEQWRAASRPRWGAPLERFRRKMLRENAAEIHVVEPAQNLDAELRRGFAVEASGWKGQAGTAILSSPQTTQFYTEVARAADARGELRLATITLDGELAAFDLLLLREGRLYLLKTGFDERQRRLAPGLVLRLSVIERCFELGLLAHDLLGDDTEWKRKFSTSSRAHLALDIYGNEPRQLAAYVWRRRLRPALARGRRAARSIARARPGMSGASTDNRPA